MGVDAAAALAQWLCWLAEGWLAEVLPEVEALRDVPQDPRYHREGDALTHTLLAVRQVDEEEDERVFWGVLLHDIGKATTTRFEEGRWRSRGHCESGSNLAEQVMLRLGRDDIAADVAWLVRHHQFHLSWRAPDLSRLTRRQARFCDHRLFPLLVRVAAIDAEASVGCSNKGEILQRIVHLAGADRHGPGDKDGGRA
jgi:putative nucleotidyltransferase with HDIG domain